MNYSNDLFELKCKTIQEKVEAARIRKYAEQGGPITLVALVKQLEVLPQDATVVTDRGGVPGELMSYRGYYSDLAFSPEGKSTTVRQVADKLRVACGGTYEGYKGGDYTMNDNTLIWIAKYGESGGIYVTDAVEREGVVVLTTAVEKERISDDLVRNVELVEAQRRIAADAEKISALEALRAEPCLHTCAKCDASMAQRPVLCTACVGEAHEVLEAELAEHRRLITAAGTFVAQVVRERDTAIERCARLVEAMTDEEYKALAKRAGVVLL